MSAWAKASRAGVAAVAMVVLAGLGTLPAAAQLVHRDSDGNLLISPLLCQTENEVRQAIAAAGFTKIALNAPIESHIRVRGTRGATVYLIDYNYCEARIVSVTPLRSAK